MAYSLSLRPGMDHKNNIISFQDDEKHKYLSIIGVNLGFMTVVSYWIDPNSKVPCHCKYKWSLRPLEVFHNDEKIYEDCFVNFNQKMNNRVKKLFRIENGR
jgi:hypothetical protein